MEGEGNSPLPHDVSVEGVEDALVGELEGVVEHHAAVGGLDGAHVTRGLRFRQLLLGVLRGGGQVRSQDT